MREMSAGAPELHGYEQRGSRYCSPQMQEREERRSRDGGRLLVVLSESGSC